MSYRDDEYDDQDDEYVEEDEEEEEESDDDDEQLASRRPPMTSPFAGTGYGSSRPGTDSERSSLGGRTFGSTSNLPGGGTSGSGQRPGTNPFSASSGSSRPGTGPLSSSSGASGSGARPGSSPFSSGSSGARPGTGPLSSSSSPSGGGSRPGSSYGGSSQPPSSPGSGSSSFGSSRPATGSGSSFGSSGSRPGTGPLPSGSGSSYGSMRSPTPATPPGGSSGKDKSEDDKGSRLGGISGVTKGLGGITSRFGGKGDQKSDRPATPKASGGSPLAKGLGGITSRFGGKSGQGSSRPAAPKASGGNPLSKGISGLRSRLGGGGKDNKSPVRPASTASAPRPGGASAPSSFGSRTAASSSASAASSRAAAPKGGFAQRLKAGLPFLRSGEPRRSTVREKVERANRTPRVDQSGLSLDTKLDILGVGLLLGSLALLFSSMSATKGQLTEAINTFLAQLLGWGALAVPIIMFGIGLWLVVRHFGDQAPVVDPIRIVGLGLLYIALLITFQYIDSYRAYYSMELLQDFLQSAIQAGRGGGWVGAEMYSFLVLNITEFGGIFVVAAVYLVGIMFALRISAADLAVFLISIGRSLGDSLNRRAQQRQAAARLAAAQRAQAAAQKVSISSQPAPELPPARSPALPAAATAESTLPASAAVEQRPIPITMGGKTVTAFFDKNETSAVETSPAPAANSNAGKQPTLASKVLGAMPLRLRGGAAEKPAPETSKTGADSAKSSGILGGRLFNRTSSATGPTAQPASGPEPSPAANSQTAARQPDYTPTPLPLPDLNGQQPAAAPAPTPQQPRAPLPTTEPPPARLGDLMRTPASSPLPAATANRSVPSNPAGAPGRTADGSVRSPLPPAEPRATAPDSSDTQQEYDLEQLADLSPARPKGTGPLPRPESPWTRSTGSGSSGPPPAPGAGGTLQERQERLNALRAGRLGEGQGTPAAPERPHAPQSPAASLIRPAGSGIPPVPPEPSRPKPAINYVKSEERGETPATAGPASQTPSNASPAFRRPDTPPVSPGMPVRRVRRTWKMPDYKTLLNIGSESDVDRETLLARARTIEETLQSFGAPGRVVEVNTGPVITQFGVEPDYLTLRSGKKSRVKVGAIAQLDKDLQLALGAKSIRIEAPVPGKGYVGIEVPNEQASLVSLRDVMDSEEFKKIRSKSALAIALGQSVDGTPVAADLASMPHLLVAGTTGSGKSVLVNAIIGCLILSNPPDKVKFIMVDPKRVELTGYNGIPHLVAPVVVELERIVGVLKWVTREMDERYKQFSMAGARNIEDFNKHLSPEQEQMPYIIVIIDELADLMMLAPDETERVVTRIAALARATGIHLVIATQRPSVDVVTGLIKANFPARIAFAVAGGVDSRVILDQPGAERLLGRGDMLYLSGDSPAPLRLQGVFLSDTEINNITRYWKMQNAEEEPARPITALVLDDQAVETPREVMPRTSAPLQAAFWDDDGPKGIDGKLLNGDSDDEEDDLPDGQDELYEQAVEMVRRLNKASVSLLQRRLRIGYTRAARLIDMMEEQGIVGPAQEGSKPREVLPVNE